MDNAGTASERPYNGIMEFSGARPIGDILKERNIELAGADPATRHGFTQVPNFILTKADISVGAKLAYAMLLKIRLVRRGLLSWPDQAGPRHGCQRAQHPQLSQGARARHAVGNYPAGPR